MNSHDGARKKAHKPLHISSIEISNPENLAEVQSLFNKVCTYVKLSGEDWSIPDTCDIFKHRLEQQHCLQVLKASLNDVKNQLSDKDVQVWHLHTNSTNRAGKVIATVRSSSNAEICTQAWCKFYEILGTFPLLPEEALRTGELNTVHLCEAPGAFITALNHHVKTSEATRYCDWCWVANTLNPYHEANGSGTTIADDRLVANTLPRWFFGPDNTGDIMMQNYLLDLQKFVSSMRRVDLITADGSFDCQENPDEQEALVASLHYCEATAALLLLSPGGSFVLKMFTLYEHSSVCLLYLLSCCFSSVSIFKPATSKAGNSEVYVVCLNYHNKESLRPLLSKLIRHYGPNMADGEALFPTALIPESFLKQHEEVCSYFHTLQVETITENLRLFKDMSAEQRQHLDRIRDVVAQEYLQRFQVSFLPRAQWVSRNTVSPACVMVFAGRPAGQKKQTGSFNQRRELQTLSWRERVQRSCHAAWMQDHCTEAGGAGCVLDGPQPNCSVDSWNVIAGGALPAIRNSAFCEGELLSLLNEALTNTAADWTQVPPCDHCHISSAASILTEVAGLCGSRPAHTERKGKRQCVVFGSDSVWNSSPSQIEDLVLKLHPEPSFPVRARGLLHDGEPLYQQQLLDCVIYSLQTLSFGDVLVLPVLSVLTRVTGAVVFCLHVCFRSVLYRCPRPCGSVGALLLCVGFCPKAAARLLPVMASARESMRQLLSQNEEMSESPCGGNQVLQLVPMEELLNGGLMKFLWSINSDIARQKLHRLLNS